MPGNIVSLPARRTSRDPAMDAALTDIRTHLREYLEMRGVQFDRNHGDKFHCFNAAAHAHGDREASASLNPQKNRTTFRCFACGISGDIFDACRMIENRETKGKEFVETAQYLAGLFKVSFPEFAGKEAYKAANKIDHILTNEYVYRDEGGNPLYRILRFNLKQYGQLLKDASGKPKKTFRPEIYQAGQWGDGYGNVKRVLYHLPDVLKSIQSGDTIFFAEGEKCADILINDLHLPATTIAGGSNAWIPPHTHEYIRALIGAKLVILIDNDSAGRRFGELVANDLVAVTSSIKLLALPGLPTKGDIEQWNLLYPKNAREELLSLTASTQEWKRDSDKTLNDYLEPIQIKDGMYIRPGDLKRPPVPISNFTIHPLHKLVPEGGDIRMAQWLVRSEIAGGASFEQSITLEAFINRMKFKAAFSHEGMSFTGTDDDIQGIKVLFGKEPYESRLGVQYIGFHADPQDGQELFVSHTRAIHADGTEADNIRLMEGSYQISTDILDAATAAPDEIPALVKALFSFNSLDKCAIIAGWVAGCFLKEKFRSKGIKYPHLFIYGEAGSGKSQTVESVIMPLFSTETKFSAGQLTDFVTFRVSSSSNTIPFVIDEYKPFAIGETRVKRISELLRNTYDQQDVGRGQKEQGITYYRYRAPVCLVGEEGTDETANKERGLELLFSKMDLFKTGHTESFRLLKEQRQAVQRLGRSILATAMSMDSQLVAVLHQVMTNSIVPKVKERMPGMPDRVADSVGCCMMGISLLDSTVAEYGGIEGLTGHSLDDLADRILDAVYQNIMDGQGTPKAAVDHILEAMSRMASVGGFYYEGVHFGLINDNTQLALDIQRMYDAFKKYRRDHDLKCESMEQSQFTKQLRHKPFFAGYKKVRFSSERRSSEDMPRINSTLRNAYVLSIQSLEDEGVDVSGFLNFYGFSDGGE